MNEVTDVPEQDGEPKDLRNDFNRDLQTSIKYMEPIHQRMDRDYEYYRNKWSKPNDDAEPTVSQLYEYVETVTPIVTNNRIRANVFSEYPEYVTHAKGINDILDHTYDGNNWDYMSQEVMREALIQRAALAYSGFDKDYKNGTGRLCIKQINSRWCYLDPGALCLDDASFFFYVEPKRKSEVIKLHPNRKAAIKAYDGKVSDTSGTGSNKWFKTFVSAVKQLVSFLDSNTKERNGGYDSVLTEMEEGQRYANSLAYIHYWYRDDDDKWRVSHWADTVWLDDEPNPFWHECLPYDIYSPIKDTRSMLGIPISEQIGSIDFQRNAVLEYAVMNARLHGNPPLMYNTTFGNVKNPERLKREADDGLILVNNPDMIALNAIGQYMMPPTMDVNAIQMPERLEGLMDKVTGVNDSFRGMNEATSGKETQLKQEASYTRIKTMIDQFELFNKKIAEKIIINAMQFYTQTRTFRIKGDYSKYQAEINAEDSPMEIKPIPKGMNPETQEPVMSRTEFFMYANPNEWTKIQDAEKMLGNYLADDEEKEESDEPKEKEEAEKAYKILSFVVEIEAGSSLPQSRLARREEASELFAAQAIDQESLLEVYDWPDREEVIKRMQEQAKAAQEATTAAAQAEAQGKVEAEKIKSQTQIQIEQMKLQGEMQKQQMSDQTKIEQQKMSNKGKEPNQPDRPQEGDIASQLEQIRKDNPEAAQMSDEELIAALTGQQPEGGPGGLAGQLDSIRQQNPEAADMSDEQLIAAITQ